MRIRDWSSDVCSSDLLAELEGGRVVAVGPGAARAVEAVGLVGRQQRPCAVHRHVLFDQVPGDAAQRVPTARGAVVSADGLLAHAATPHAIPRSRRGCASTTCPWSRAKPTRFRAADSDSATARAPGAENAPTKLTHA